MGYATRNGNSVIDDWAASVPDEALAKFDSRLRFMRDEPTWPRHYAHMRKDSERIWEMLFEVNHIAYRPLFFCGPAHRLMTFVGFATEHNDNLKPIDVVASSIKRMREIIKSPERAIEYEL